MASANRRRIRAASPNGYLCALGPFGSELSIPQDCEFRTKDREDDVCSVTEESVITMPRRSPCLELANYMRQEKYIDCLQLQRQALDQQLHRAIILYMKSRVGRSKYRSPIRRRTARKPRSHQWRLQFQAALMQYQDNLRAYNDRILFPLILLSERYLATRMLLPKTFIWLTEILPNSPDHIFEAHTRMTRRSFGLVLHVLETKTPHFFRSRRGRKQTPISKQLHLALFTLGFYGNGANFESARAKFGYGVGTVLNARRRVVNAIVSLTAEYIKWPTSSQRRELCREVREKHGYHSAFFAVDGTTHPFAFVPSYQRNSWYDRKSRYSMQVLVTNDMDLRVIHLVVGWPGSAHDARILGSADYMLDRNEQQYFDGEQHGLGDAAFGLHKRVVPNYKEPLAGIPENTEYNRCNSSMRVRSEHTIEHVKNRFQGLKEVRLRMTKESEVREVVKYITAGYVLHNMLLDFNDEYRATSNSLDRQEEEIQDSDTDETDPMEEDVDMESTAAMFRETVKEQVLSFHNYH